MYKNTCFKIALLPVLVGTLLAGCATKTPENTKTSMSAADQTLTTFLRDPDMKWLQANIKNAKGLVICPDVFKAGFIVGGSGGQCMVIANGHSGWSGPAFYHIATASIGLQAGASSSDIVMAVMTDKAMGGLLSSGFKLGGDASVAAGPVGQGIGAPISSDVVAYARSKGLYGGVNFNGTGLTVDDSANQAYYGKAVTPTDILVNHNVRNPESAPLLQTAAGTKK